MTTRIVRGLSNNRTYDLLVIGAGVTGCAIAYEAASRGLAVALVEKGDIGGATSAATGKLIHGGLRYLKNLEFSLVREALRERRILSDIAPGLVEPIPIILPEPSLIARVGLTAYDLLSFDRNRVRDPFHRLPAHRRMRRSELASQGLSHLRDAILYYDCMMPCPERLTLAFARSAAAHGAEILTYGAVQRLRIERGRVTGAEATDLETGAEFTLHARFTVNATGPWAHDLLLGAPDGARFISPRPSIRSEGLYLVTRKLTETMVLFVSDGGHFSFAPWRGHSLIGPTETPYRGSVEDWRPTRKNIEAFLAHINAKSGLSEPLRYEDVQAVYGGLRPLTESSADDTYQASRASELIDHAPKGLDGLLTATGGKYTTSRAFAEKTVSHAAKRLDVALRPSSSADAPLDGCAIGPREAAISAAQTRWPDAPAHTVAHLVRHYGQAADDVLTLARDNPALAEPLNQDGEILAQAVYAVRHEAATRLSDIALRRTGIGTLGDPGDKVMERLADVAAAEAGWSPERRAQELSAARQAIQPPTADL